MGEYDSALSKPNKKTFVGLDLFKLIGALLILFEHTAPYIRGLSTVSYVITNYAVGFFFITSGFFFGRSLLSKLSGDEGKEYFKKYEWRLFKIYLVWTLISLPLNVRIYWNKYPNPLKFALAMLRNFCLTGSYGIYWFILSLMGAAALVYLFINVIKKEKLMYVLAVLLFIIGVLNTYYKSALNDIQPFTFIFKGIYLIWSTSRNFALTGWFYVSIGFFFAKHSVKLKLPSAIILYVFATALRVFEYYAYSLTGLQFLKENSLMFAIVLQAIAFFAIAYNLKAESLKKYSLTMRQLSTTVFYLHMIVLGIIDPYLKKGFCFDFFIPLAVAIVFFIIIKLINNKHLNILING